MGLYYLYEQNFSKVRHSILRLLLVIGFPERRLYSVGCVAVSLLMPICKRHRKKRYLPWNGRKFLYKHETLYNWLLFLGSKIFPLPKAATMAAAKFQGPLKRSYSGQ